MKVSQLLQPNEAPKKEHKKLPTEILLMIFSYLDPDKNKQDLLSLCRVSTQFSQAAQPFLFETYSKSPHRLVNEYYPLTIFTKQILERPDLAKRVSRVTVRDLLTVAEELETCDDWALLPGSPFWQAITKLSTEFKKLDLSEEGKKWCLQQLQILSFSPLIAIMFANLPKLEELTIHIRQMRWVKVQHLFDHVGPKTNLKKIEIAVEPEIPPGIRLAYVLGLLSQPKLEHFTINHVMMDWASLPLLPVELSSITTLVLKDCMMDRISFNYLLDSCTNLKSLTYSYRDSMSIFSAGFPLNAIEFEIVLQRAGISLTYLDVRFNLHRPEALTMARDVEFRALDFLTELKYLSVEQCCLTECPLLPPSLETLIIVACDEPVLQMVKDLVQQNIHEVPNLRKVVVCPDPKACCRVLDIHPPVTMAAYRNDPAARRLFCEKVKALEHEAEFGYFDFTVECELYQIALNDMLHNKVDFD